MKSVLITLLLLFAFLSVHPQKVLVSAKTDRQRILIGEPIQLTFEVVSSGRTQVKWTKFDTLPHFEVLAASQVDTQRISKGTLYRQTVTITSWDSGTWDIPPVIFEGVKTVAIRIHVDHTPFDNNLPYNDVKTIIDVPKGKPSGWHWYLIGAILFIMLFYLFFPDRSAKDNETYKGNAYEEALQQLHNLKSDAGEPTLYYSRLVRIFRDYVYRKKRVYSYSKTTDDLVLLIKQFDLPAEQQAEVGHSFRLADMVKFARYRPKTEENEQSLQNVKQAIITIESRK